MEATPTTPDAGLQALPGADADPAITATLASVFDPTPADDAATDKGVSNETSLTADGADGADEESSGDDDDASSKSKTKKPDASAGKATVTHRGKEFQVDAGSAEAFAALQADYKALEAEFTRTRQTIADGQSKPDPEKAKAAREVVIAKYDAALWEAIDAKDGKGLTENILKINRAYMGDALDQIDALKGEIDSLKSILYSGPVADSMVNHRMAAALLEDLPRMGHDANAVTAETIRPEYDRLVRDMPGQPARELYLIALGKVLGKKPGPKPASKPEIASSNGSIPEFSRPAAPNRVAPSSIGRDATAPTQPARPITGSPFNESL